MTAASDPLVATKVQLQGDSLVVKSGGVIVVETGASVLANGVEVANGQLATIAEINRAADTSTRVVDLAVSTSITELAHDGKTIVMGGAGSARTFTLPVPAPGMKFRFVVGAVNTSNYLIKSVAGTQVMGGTIVTLSDNSAAVLGYTAGATDDTITLNGSTTGGASIGDWVQVEALTAMRWAVSGLTTSSGSEATPFSDTVA
jgi:hypothetical protein